MRKYLFILFVIIIAASATTFSTPAEEQFKQANDLYQKGEYDKASAIYEEIIDQGYSNAEVYYNLGNAYYKLDKVPDAIINYERARRLNPDDEDIDFNLNIANLKIVDKIKPVPKFFLTEWLIGIRDLWGSRTWAIFAVIFVWVAAIFLSGFILIWSPSVKKLMFSLAIISVILATFSFVFGWQSSEIEKTHDHAIIFPSSVYVKSSPDENGNDLFILHEGTKVQIMDKVGDWNKIKLADGNVGWLLAETVEVI